MIRQYSKLSCFLTLIPVKRDDLMRPRQGSAGTAGRLGGGARGHWSHALRNRRTRVPTTAGMDTPGMDTRRGVVDPVTRPRAVAQFRRIEAVLAASSGISSKPGFVTPPGFFFFGTFDAYVSAEGDCDHLGSYGAPVGECLMCRGFFFSAGF
jgi:hypothetical protein